MKAAVICLSVSNNIIRPRHPADIISRSALVSTHPFDRRLILIDVPRRLYLLALSFATYGFCTYFAPTRSSLCMPTFSSTYSASSAMRKFVATYDASMGIALHLIQIQLNLERVVRNYRELFGLVARRACLATDDCFLGRLNGLVVAKVR